MTTKANFGFGFFRATCLALLIVAASLLQSVRAADTNAPLDATQGAPADTVRSYSQIEEQLLSAQLALEKYRQDADAAAASNSVAMDDRLKAMEKAFADERLEQLSNIEHSTRMVLIASGAVAAIGFVALALAAFLQWTAVNRLSSVAARLSAQSPPALGLGETALLPAGAVEQSNTRFLGLIERLEQRIHELEASLTPHKALAEGSETNGNGAAKESAVGAVALPAGPGKSSMVDLMLSKSQTLLKLGKAEAALGCLDEILVMDPDNALALVKKGGALERLQRFEDALQCYDRAIAHDNSMTIAYLCKGGVFNRLERYTEALACYELALKKTDKPASPPS
ncbi:MAG TPA: tetratricopeptide repeat protein [Verrucomicrobiae bacterium]|nr:tetratricopeptide repeat protein [Verrucomicrobiae bacterium]